MKRSSALISLFAILLFAVGIGLWQYLSPPIYDDIHYLHFCLPTTENDFWELEGDFITSYSQAAHSVANHWQLVNGRLTNAITTFLLISPPWLLASLQALMALIMIVGIVYFGIGRKALGSSWICAILTLLIWKLLPWHNNMNSDDYAINYMWTSALVLVFLAVVLHPACLDTRLKRWLWALPALLIGMMHEGFSIPVLAALFVLYVFPSIYPDSQHWPEDWRKRMVVPVLAFAFGACCCIFAPSTISRLIRQGDQVPSQSPFTVAKLLFFHLLPLFLYIAVTLLALWKRGWQRVLTTIKSQALWLVMFIIAFAIAVTIRLSAARMIWFAGVIFIILSLQMLCTLGHAWLRPRKGIAIAAIALQIVFLYNVITLQSKIGSELSRAVSEFRQRADGYLYFDYTPQGKLPWWTFGLVHSYVNTDMFNLQMVKSLPQFKGISDASALTLPTDYTDFKDYNDFPPIPGKNPFRGIYPVVLSTRYIAPGTKLNVKFGEASGFINPLRRKMLPSAPGRLTVSKSMILPMLLPDTVYSIYFYETITRDVKEINLDY